MPDDLSGWGGVAEEVDGCSVSVLFFLDGGVGGGVLGGAVRGERPSSCFARGSDGVNMWWELHAAAFDAKKLSVSRGAVLSVSHVRPPITTTTTTTISTPTP